MPFTLTAIFWFFITLSQSISVDTGENNKSLASKRGSPLKSSPRKKILTVPSDQSKKVLTDIHIGVLIPFVTSKDKFHYGSALKVAAQLINNDSNILQNYRIVLHVKDTGGRTGFALTSLFKLLAENPRKAAIIGPGNSKAVRTTSKLCSARRILQMSYSAVDPELGNKEKFQTLFRSNPGHVSVNLAQISLFKYNNWKRTAILYDVEDSMMFQTAEELSLLMASNNIDVIAFESFTSSRQEHPEYDVIKMKIQKFKDLDARIIMAGLRRPSLKHVFCEAYKQNMTGDRYMWIILFEDTYTDWYDSRFLNSQDCNSGQLLEAANRFMYLSFAALRRDDEVTVAHETADAIWNIVRREIHSLYPSATPPTNLHYNVLSMYAYDSLWALATLLDTAEKKLPHYSLEALLQRNGTLVQQLAHIMEKNVKFQGVSGYYSYLDKVQDSRDRIGDILYLQFSKNGTYNVVGYHNAGKRKVFMNISTPGMKHKNAFPSDGPVITYIPLTLDLAILLPTWSFTVAGIILSLLFLFGNIKHRKLSMIKLSSPNINNAIIIGCILCYLSVGLFSLDSRTISIENIPIACNAIVICLSIGFTLSFGGLFSKTWRIYRIFTRTKVAEGNGIKDIHLFGVLSLMFLIDILMFAIWMLVSPFSLQMELLEPVIDLERDTHTFPVIHRCKCGYQSYFSFTFYIYKGLLLLFGLFVAWETRNIKITAINDSRFIGMAVYNVAVLSSIAVVGTTAMHGTVYFQASYLIFAICIILCTTTTLCLVFVPKIKILATGYEDPNFKNGRPILSIQNSTRRPKTDSNASNAHLTDFHAYSDRRHLESFERRMTGSSVGTLSTNGSFVNTGCDSES